MQSLFIDVLMLYNCRGWIKINRGDTHCEQCTSCELTLSIYCPILHRFHRKNMFSSSLSIDSGRADVSASMCQLKETSALMVCSNARHRSCFQLSCLHRHHFLLCWHRKLVERMIFLFVCFVLAIKINVKLYFYFALRVFIDLI